MIFWTRLRLLLASLCVLAASFAVFRAPAMPFFALALIATELGHWAALGPLLLACLPSGRSVAGGVGTILCVIAGALFLSSAVRAQRVAARLPADLARAFPGAVAGHSAAFSWRRLWFTPDGGKTTAEEHEFARPDGHSLRLHVFRSAAHHPAPCIVIIHGGGWVNGSANEFPALSRHLASRGYVVAAVEYRFAPKFPWPAQRDDVAAALKFLKEHAAGFGIDPERFVLLGRSAGGQIAEAVAYGAHDPAIRGCISFYAPADLHFAYRYARSDDILDSLKLVTQYLGGTPTEAGPNYDSASGILLASADSPPTLLLHGGRDELVWFRQSQRLDSRLQELGVAHYFVQLPWATHAFDYTPNGPGGQISTYAVDTFLSAVFSPVADL